MSLSPTKWLTLGALYVLGASAAGAGQQEAFSRAGWLADLEVVRSAFATKYPDLEWEVFERGVNLKRVFSEARAGIELANSDSEAERVFDHLAHQFGNRHVRFRWPEAGRGPEVSPDTPVCGRLGYDERMQAPPVAALIPGFEPLSPQPSTEFPSGTLRVGKHLLGVLKIPLFSPQGFPALCQQAVLTLGINTHDRCDASCADRTEAAAARQLTLDLARTLAAIRASGADTLLIDISGNGGGSEWAEAAARMVTEKRLNGIPTYFARGEHWAVRFTHWESELRRSAASAQGADRALLSQLAEEVAQRRAQALTPCPTDALWEGKHPPCNLMGEGFFSTGLLQAANRADLVGKPWGELVFSPLQYPYQDGIWRGPLIVAIDGGTGSAASQFAAELQDNRAAILIGSTAPAGCGHTDGGTPTLLPHSRGVLELPDCERIRVGGQNLADGVRPDIHVEFSDGEPAQARARRLMPAIVQATEQMSQRNR
jgi:peptidase S41-like protein